MLDSLSRLYHGIESAVVRVGWMYHEMLEWAGAIMSKNVLDHNHTVVSSWSRCRHAVRPDLFDMTTFTRHRDYPRPSISFLRHHPPPSSPPFSFSFLRSPISQLYTRAIATSIVCTKFTCQ